MKIFKINKGVGFAEMIVVVAIFSVISIAVANFGAEIFNFNSTAGSNLTAQSEGRRVIKTMVKELRSISPSSSGSYALSQVGTSSIIFFTDTNNDGVKERIRYFLQGTEIKRGVIVPSGNPLSYTASGETIITIIRGVQNGNTPIFEYFDQSYTGSSSALAQPVQATAVRLVKINLILDSDPNKEGGIINVTSQVTLRNLKDNL